MYIQPTRAASSLPLLGVALQFSPFEEALSSPLRVLGLLGNSPAQKAGLQAGTDYILGDEKVGGVSLPACLLLSPFVSPFMSPFPISVSPPLSLFSSVSFWLILASLLCCFSYLSLLQSVPVPDLLLLLLLLLLVIIAAVAVASAGCLSRCL